MGRRPQVVDHPEYVKNQGPNLGIQIHCEESKQRTKQMGRRSESFPELGAFEHNFEFRTNSRYVQTEFS